VWKGFATAEGTARYRDRFPRLRDAGHFRPGAAGAPGAGELWMPSIGLGTYLGEPDAAGDARYTLAIAHALRSGIHLLDTAINYRHQRSERNLGAALEQLFLAKELQRDEVVVCTKAGYLAFDGEMPSDPRQYFQREYVQRGLLDPAEVAGGMHCMAPRYLADQIERSRRNLGLETLDVFYVHNPESQFASVDAATFRACLKEAFVMLEGAVREGKLRYYGAATWGGFRAPAEAPDALHLSAMLDLAREAGGDGHHFRFVQLPFNLALPEAYSFRNQTLGGEPASTLALAAAAGMVVVGSATLYQGQLTRDLPAFVRERLGMATDAESAIQFARSAPGLATALVGMSRREHVDANLKVAAHPLTPPEEWKKLFVK
jgi:aryl-alcohol dehydrogenase-like predicted oxidoreductase